MYSPSHVSLAFVLLACIVATVVAQRGGGFGGSPPPCTATLRGTQTDSLEQNIANLLLQNQRLRAGFVRAAFHDCITATSDKPDSGCNGSLQFELGDPNNNRLQAAVGALQQRLLNRHCVSLADAIQLASAVAVRDFGGPDVVADVVDVNNPRVDAAVADTTQGELPSRTMDFMQLVAFYQRKGLSATDLVASSAGAHSLGRFTDNVTNNLLRFTPDPGLISPSYAWNLVRFAITGNDETGHNTMQSDRALAGPANAQLRVYAGCVDANCATSTSAGMPTLNTEFGAFLIKQSNIRGSTLPTI